MKILRVSALVLALACSAYAGEIPYGVTATGDMQNGVTATVETPNNITAAGEMQNGITFLTLLTLFLR
jgi:hypothetical protein